MILLLRIVILALLVLSSVSAQTSDSASAESSSLALALQLKNFYFSNGTTVLQYSPERALVFHFTLGWEYNVSKAVNYGIGGPTATYSIRSLWAPGIGFHVRFLDRKSVCPYVGAHIATRFYVHNGQAPRYTILEPSWMFGVEAWLTNWLSVAGEQRMTGLIYLNGPSALDNLDYASTSMLFLFYF